MSEKLARELFSEVQQLGHVLAKSGWCDSDGRLPDAKSPVDLFKTQERPLVVGLFGGTGVGKSSLLNRLAGMDIARTGVVRPTSMEITAYLHRDVHLDALPEHFDAKCFSDNRHDNDLLAEVMWVDMPDFDSHETENKDQVLQWLPHIDLLLYVVTPERYKDAEGWRMMIDNGYRHAWLFVINQWDRAEAVQYTDFSGLLERAGFKSPQIYRTVCVGQHSDDQFDEMISVIKSLSKANVVKHLQERGWTQRLARSESQLKKHMAVLSAEGSLPLSESLTIRWQEFSQSVASHLDRPFITYSEQFAKDKTGAVGSVLKSLTGNVSTKDIASNIAAKKAAGLLWDDWLNVRYQDSLQQLILAENEHGLPKHVFSALDNTTTAENEAVMKRHLNEAVDAAIKQPGTPAQRLLAKVASVAKLVFPVLALVWVAWRVLNGFITGAEDRTAYVGMDFLVNGLLLAGLGWVIPVVVEKLFVPSMPDSVYRALHQGLQDGLQEGERRLRPELAQLKEDRAEYLARCTQLRQRIAGLVDTSTESADPIISRVLMSERS